MDNKKTKKIDTTKPVKTNKVIYWLPRVLGILISAFIAMFSFDVFGEGYVWYEAIGAFLMHNVPVYFLVALLIWAWKRPYWAGVAYVVLGVAFTIFFKSYEDIITFLLIGFPPIVIGVLFWLEGKATRKSA